MTIRILVGDARERLRELPDNFVHCVVTSPPYFGLRDYGTAKWEGGDIACRHVVGEMRRGLGLAQSPANTRGGAIKVAETPDIQARAVCPHCGARRTDNQIGLEETPAQFVAALVDLFREVRRVLRDDGTVWLNLGDSYNAYNGNRGSSASLDRRRDAAVHVRPKLPGGSGLTTSTLKNKDLIGIPWRVAFALQDDGWYLRQDIIWAKPNPMPESVTDRCTKAHEYLFLLAKSERYAFDQQAIMEAVTASTIQRLSQPTLAEQYGSDRVPGKTNGPMKAKPRKKGNAKTFRGGTYVRGQSFDNSTPMERDSTGNAPNESELRNRRSVWTVSTAAFAGEFCQSCRVFFQGDRLAALKVEKKKDGERERRIRHCTCGCTDRWLSHFATFPADLIEPCILAGAPPITGIVLDPFGGAGTTGLVAHQLSRQSILLELNPDYAEMAKQRIIADGGMFASVLME